MDEKEILKSLTILYVEDNQSIREVVVKFLKRKVKEVISAENGKDGLEVLKTKEPDIIITDIEMPVMNGVDMIEQIRKLSFNKPIIVVTAYKDDEHHSKLADGYIFKPIKFKELLTMIVNLHKK